MGPAKARIQGRNNRSTSWTILAADVLFWLIGEIIPLCQLTYECLLVHDMDQRRYCHGNAETAEILGAQSSTRTLKLLRLLAKPERPVPRSASCPPIRPCQANLPPLAAVVDRGGHWRRRIRSAGITILAARFTLLGMVAAERYGIHRIALDSVIRLPSARGMPPSCRSGRGRMSCASRGRMVIFRSARMCSRPATATCSAPGPGRLPCSPRCRKRRQRPISPATPKPWRRATPALVPLRAGSGRGSPRAGLQHEPGHPLSRLLGYGDGDPRSVRPR